jgi:CDP-diacylglycerol--serine O-phosphatidyltransferase
MATRSKKIKKLPRQKTFDLHKLFPNIVTLAGLCSGVTAIRFALAERWELALTFIVIASFIDGIDGKLARALNATSNFGSQLDSLCDFVNFGFVPVFVLYLWGLHSVPAFGWAAVLFYTVCCSIRLARFNSDLDMEDDPAEWHSKFFTGVPSPAGALMCVAPIMAHFFLTDRFPELIEPLGFIFNPVFLVFYAIFIASLMASRIPTYSLKQIIIKKRYASLLMVFIGICVISAFIELWLTVLFVGFVYFFSLPFSTLHYLKLKQNG